MVMDESKGIMVVKPITYRVRRRNENSKKVEV